MKKLPVILIILILILPTVLAATTKSTGSVIGNFFHNAVEVVKKVVSDLIDGVHKIVNVVSGQPTNKNLINYQPNIISNTPSPTPNPSNPTSDNKVNKDNKPTTFTSDNGEDTTATYVPQNTQYDTAVGQYDPLYFNVKINKVEMKCPSCPVINGVKTFTAGFPYELYVDLINSGNIASDGVEMTLKVTDENGYLYETSFTGKKSISIPVGETLVGPIIITQVGAEYNTSINTVRIDSRYIYNGINDKMIIEMKAEVKLSKSYLVVEPGHTFIEHVTRSCKQQTSEGRTSLVCTDTKTYEDKLYYPDVKIAYTDINLIEILPITKLVPKIASSIGGFCVASNDVIKVGTC